MASSFTGNREGKDAYGLEREPDMIEEQPFGAVLDHGEFDPGSERTLAARFKHASRGVGILRSPETGERVSNT